jgi:hypothetical protein
MANWGIPRPSTVKETSVPSRNEIDATVKAIQSGCVAHFH